MIVRFNLLPYRLIEKQQRRRRYYHKLIMAFTAALCSLYLLHCYLTEQQKHQLARNQILESASQQLAPQLRQVKTLNTDLAELQKQLALLENLRRQQHWYAVLLVDLARQVPKEVTLNSLKLDGRNITITGRARSTQALSQLWQNLNSQAISIEQVELNEMRTALHQNTSTHSEQENEEQAFVMVARLRQPPMDDNLAP